jgi:hypothetical protein
MIAFLLSLREDLGIRAWLPASFALWPALAMSAWKRRQSGLAWALLAVDAVECFVFGLSWGGVQAITLVPFLFGNLAWRRAEREAAAVSVESVSQNG